MLDYLKQIDFVTGWKTISIFLTGAFGILGLTKNFKKKVRNEETDTIVEKITVWGWVSLVGIVLSSVLGIAAQLKESQDNAAKALNIAERSEETLVAIQNVLRPFDVAEAFLTLKLHCGDGSRFRDYCKKRAEGMVDWDLFRGDLRHPRTEVIVGLIKEPKLLNAYFSNNSSLSTDPSKEFDVSFYISADLRKEEFHGDPDNSLIDFTNTKDSPPVIEMRKCKVQYFHTDGIINSVADLPGTTLVLAGFQLTDLEPDRGMLKTSKGEEIEIPVGFKKHESKPDSDGQTYSEYYYTFPIPPKMGTKSQSSGSSEAPSPAQPNPATK